MSKYLIHFNGKGRVSEIDGRSTSSEDWGAILEGFAREALNGRKPEDPRFVCAEAIHLYDGQTTPQGIPYDWELCGPGGGSYRLLVFWGQDSDAVKLSGEWLCRQFDVVHLHVLRVDLVAPAITSERVFSGVFPCGIGYADPGL